MTSQSDREETTGSEYVEEAKKIELLEKESIAKEAQLEKNMEKGKDLRDQPVVVEETKVSSEKDEEEKKLAEGLSAEKSGSSDIASGTFSQESLNPEPARESADLQDQPVVVEETKVGSEKGEEEKEHAEELSAEQSGSGDTASGAFSQESPNPEPASESEKGGDETSESQRNIAKNLESLLSRSVAKYDRMINEEFRDAPVEVREIILSNLGQKALDELDEKKIKWREFLGLSVQQAMMIDKDLYSSVSLLKPEIIERYLSREESVIWNLTKNIINSASIRSWHDVGGKKDNISLTSTLRKMLMQTPTKPLDGYRTAIRSIMWRATTLHASFESCGKHIDELSIGVDSVVVSLPRLIKEEELETDIRQVLSSKTMIDLKDVDRYFPEAYVDILNTSFDFVGKEYGSVILLDMLINGEDISRLGVKEDKTIMSKEDAKRISNVRNRYGMVMEAKKLGYLQTVEAKTVYSGVKVLEVIESLTGEIARHLEAKFVNYATAIETVEKDSLINLGFFSFNCSGDGFFLTKEYSSKVYRLAYETEKLFVELTIKIANSGRCMRNTLYTLEVLGNVSIRQPHIVEIYGNSLDSPGLLQSSLEDITDVQNETMDYMLLFQAIENIETDKDYTLMNCNSIMPMMSFAGVRPAKFDNDVVAGLWSTCVSAILRRTCTTALIFKDSEERRHFLRCLTSSLLIGAKYFDSEDMRRLIIQSLIWAVENRFTKRAHGSRYSSYVSGDSDKKIESEKGLAPQVTWAIQCLMYGGTKPCEIGYCFLPVILTYNYIMSGDVSIKAMSMSAWISSAFNSQTERNKEDDRLIEMCLRMGYDVYDNDVVKLKNNGDVGQKIIVASEIVHRNISTIEKVRKGMVVSSPRIATTVVSMMLEDGSPKEVEKSIEEVEEIISDMADDMAGLVTKGIITKEDMSSILTDILSELAKLNEQVSLLTSKNVRTISLAEDIAKKKNMMNQRVNLEKAISGRSRPETKLYTSEIIRNSVAQWSVNFATGIIDSTASFHIPIDAGQRSVVEEAMSSRQYVSNTRHVKIGDIGSEREVHAATTKIIGPGIAAESSTMTMDGIPIVTAAVATIAETGRRGENSVSSSAVFSVLSGFDIKIGVAARIDVEEFNKKLNLVLHEPSKAKRVAAGLFRQESKRIEDNEVTIINSSICLKILLETIKKSFRVEVAEEEMYRGTKLFIAQVVMFPINVTDLILSIASLSCDAIWELCMMACDGLTRTLEKIENSPKSVSIAGSGLNVLCKNSASMVKYALMTTMAGYRLSVMESMMRVEQIVTIAKGATVYLIVNSICLNVEQLIVCLRLTDLTNNQIYEVKAEYYDFVNDLVRRCNKLKVLDNWSSRLMEVPLSSKLAFAAMTAVSKTMSFSQRSLRTVGSVMIDGVIMTGKNIARAAEVVRENFSRLANTIGAAISYIKGKTKDLVMKVVRRRANKEGSERREVTSEKTSASSSENRAEKGREYRGINSVIGYLSDKGKKLVDLLTGLIARLTRSVRKSAFRLKNGISELKSKTIELLKKYAQEIRNIGSRSCNKIADKLSEICGKFKRKDEDVIVDDDGEISNDSGSSLLDNEITEDKKEASILETDKDVEVVENTEGGMKDINKDDSKENGLVDALIKGMKKVFTRPVGEKTEEKDVCERSGGGKRNNDGNDSSSSVEVEHRDDRERERIEMKDVDDNEGSGTAGILGREYKESGANIEQSKEDEKEEGRSKNWRKDSDEQRNPEVIVVESCSSEEDSDQDGSTRSYVQNVTDKGSRVSILRKMFEKSDENDQTKRIAAIKLEFEEAGNEEECNKLEESDTGKERETSMTSAASEESLISSRSVEASSKSHGELEGEGVTCSKIDAEEDTGKVGEKIDGGIEVVSEERKRTEERSEPAEAKVMDETDEEIDENIELGRGVGEGNEVDVPIEDNSTKEVSVEHTSLIAGLGLGNFISDQVKKIAKNAVTDWSKDRKANRKKADMVTELCGAEDRLVSNLELERDKIIRGNISMASVWPALDDKNCVSSVCQSKHDKDLVVDVIRRNELLIHCHSKSVAVDLARINIFSANEVALLVVPSDYEDVEKTIANCMVDELINEENWISDSCCSIRVGMAVKNSKMEVAVCSVIKDNEEKIEACFLPQHVSGYGNDRRDSKNLDDLVCLAYCSSDSEYVSNVEMDIEEEQSTGEAKLDCIVAIGYIPTVCEWYRLAVTENRDWGGHSGSPVTLVNGALVGICVMQLKLNGGTEVATGKSIIVCSSLYYASKTLLVMLKPMISMCTKTDCSRISLATGSSNKAKDGRLHLNEDGNEVSNTADKQGYMQRVSGFFSEYIFAKHKKENKMDEEIVDRDEVEEEFEDAKSKLGTASVNSKSEGDLKADQTGALMDICRIATIRKGKDGLTSLDEKTTFRNMVKIAENSERKMTSDIGKMVIEAVIKAVISKEKLLLVCVSNTMALSICCMLTAMRVQFDRYRSMVDCGARMNSRFRGSSRDVAIMTVEDIMINVCSGSIMKSRNINVRSVCLVMSPDDIASKKALQSCLRMLALKFSDIKTVFYPSVISGMTNSRTIKSKPAESVLTYDGDRFQNEGLLNYIVVNNRTIRRAENNEEIIPGKIRPTTAVLTMSKEAKNFGYLARRAAGELEINEKSVMTFNFASMSIAGMWDLIRSCNRIVLSSASSMEVAEGIAVTVKMCQEMSSSEFRIFQDAYNINDLMHGVSVMDSGTSFSVDLTDRKRIIFEEEKHGYLVISNKNDGSAAQHRIGDVRKMTENLSLNGALILSDNKELEFDLMEINAENGFVSRDYRDRDLLSKDVIEQKTVGKNIFNLIAEKCLCVYGKGRMALFSILRKVHSYAQGKIDAVKRIAFEIKQATSDTAKSMTRHVRGVYKQMLAACRGMSGISAEATAFNERDENRDGYAGRFTRALTVFVTVNDFKRVNNKLLSDKQRLDYSITASMVWMILEAVTGEEDNRIARFMRKAVDCLGKVQTIAWAARIVLGWRMVIKIKGAEISTSGAADNMLLMTEINKMKMKAARALEGISCSQTSLIIDMKERGLVKQCCLHAVNMINNAVNWLTKTWLKWSLKETMVELWKGIKQRNENFRVQSRKLDFAPCVELQDIIAGSVLIAGSMGIIYKLSSRKVEAANATIGVVAEKKNVPDMILVYMEDREVFCLVSRLVSLLIGSTMIYSSTLSEEIAGWAVIVLTSLDILLGKKSSVGVSYKLGNCISRVFYARSKWVALCNGVMSWYYAGSITEDGLNAIVLTSKRNEIDKNKTNKIAKRLDEAIKRASVHQKKEREANEIMMNEKLDPVFSYETASKIINGKKRKTGLFNEEEWSFDRNAGEEVINLSLISRKGVGLDDWNSVNEDIVTSIKRICKNQCRYIGRVMKLATADEVFITDYMEKQESVTMIDDNLWEGVIEESDRLGYEAAGDSRYAVLMAISERNDMPIKLDVLEKDIALVAKCMFSILRVMQVDRVACRTKVLGMDWVTMMCTVNEKSTSGILTRKRTGKQLSAAYLPHYGKRPEIVKEMLIDSSLTEEASVVDVFAKRRIEKKKISRLTGVECVITRTIQAHEIDLKMADIEAFLIMDKILKVTRCRNGLAVGLNYFIEYSLDEFNIMKSKGRGEGKRKRISLDHSSFDGSQRNWSLSLCNELRKTFHEITSARGKLKTVGNVGNYIDKSYEALYIRLMLTTSGDLFAVTGQQMSGHATTSSDNSLKSRAYAMACAKMAEEENVFKVVEGSIRAQGDDTKMDIVIKRDESITNEDIKNKIQDWMGRLGQNVKAEKILVTDEYDQCSFLSHGCKLYLFEMEDKYGRKWLESGLFPMRERRDIMAMLATALKADKGKDKKSYKRKKDLSLLAAKAMSYLLMYAADAVIGCFCCVVIWACFKVLSALKHASRKIDIKQVNLPWIAAQAEIEGEFEVDIVDILSKHGLTRSKDGDKPTKWIFRLDDETDKLFKRVRKFVINATKTFKYIGDWDPEEIIKAVSPKKYGARTTCGNVSYISIVELNNVMSKCKKGVSFSITSNEMTYKPFVDMKAEIKKKKDRSGKTEEVTIVKVILFKKMNEETEEDDLVKNRVIKRHGNWNREPKWKKGLKFLSKEGVIIELPDALRVNISDEDDRIIVLVKTTEEMRTIKISPWDTEQFKIMEKRKIEKMEKVDNELIMFRTEFGWQLLTADKNIGDADKMLEDMTSGKTMESKITLLRGMLEEEKMDAPLIIIKK